MNNKWFGPLPWGRCCFYNDRCATPIGQSCLFCEESISSEDCGLTMPFASAEEEIDIKPIHTECLLRQTIGSVGHQRKTCSCFGGTEEDPPGLTKRQAALAAVREYEGTAVTPNFVVEPSEGSGREVGLSGASERFYGAARRLSSPSKF